ncbi:hypothetical protein [Alicyclobacillus mengziensis]|uniref:Uncharacterized protein n=1 Tax=Alicyclobacillus mengziensis TaxID=2931921 RepID=A0A9X7VY66_9BACL|nr:hypothetical protein [Alicyclobacillus mengziensis]QSO46874.1 hypothetical protein JZ786_20970 [Alicyclobacillus mengziensis]
MKRLVVMMNHITLPASLWPSCASNQSSIRVELKDDLYWGEESQTKPGGGSQMRADVVVYTTSN